MITKKKIIALANCKTYELIIVITLADNLLCVQIPYGIYYKAGGFNFVCLLFLV